MVLAEEVRGFIVVVLWGEEWLRASMNKKKGGDEGKVEGGAGVLGLVYFSILRIRHYGSSCDRVLPPSGIFLVKNLFAVKLLLRDEPSDNRIFQYLGQ